MFGNIVITGSDDSETVFHGNDRASLLSDATAVFGNIVIRGSDDSESVFHGNDRGSFLSDIKTMLSPGMRRYKAVTSQPPASMVDIWGIDIGAYLPSLIKKKKKFSYRDF